MEITASRPMTYTVETENGQETREALLIEIPSDQVGHENVKLEPPTAEQDIIGNYLRGGYLHKGDSILAQVPRQSNWLPLTETKRNLNSVIREGETLHFMYPVSDSMVFIISWDVATDEWKYVTHELDPDVSLKEYITSAGDETVWQS